MTLKKILYIEDDEIIAEIVMMTLEDIGGYDVKYCPTGKEALKCFEEFNPQLVLTDVMMPDMDGPETMRELRLLEGGKTIPVVFMTAKAQMHEQKAYLEMGAVGVIVKPFKTESLCDEIEALFSKHG